MKILFFVAQVLALVALAPLVSGIIRKIKNNLRMRQGPGILQPYYNLIKLFGKDEVISVNTSWIFTVTPYVVLVSSVLALMLVPVFVSDVSMNYMGDFLLIIFILALGRFFLALAGLDAGSSFGGMGSSREMFISSFVEPVVVMVIFVVALNAHSTGLQVISAVPVLSLPLIIAATAMMFVIIAETSRIPVDNQETHLELTMVHEAMVLEYSGRSLALIELAAHVKQIVFFSLIASVILPFGIARDIAPMPLLASFIYYGLKIMALTVIISVIEISMAKMRLFRVIDFLNIAFVLSVLGIVILAMGK